MKANPLILGLETATMAGSVCLALGNEILVSQTGDASTSHSNTLLRDIHQVLDQARVSLNDIDVFAAAVGPGSFTGLRIGLATTKALAATLSRQCLSVPTLAALASAAGVAENVIALLPAGRGEVFVQLFSVAGEADVTPVDEAAHLSPAKMLERYAKLETAIMAGEGAELHRNAILDYASANSRNWSIARLDRELAKHVALIGLKLYRAQKTIGPESLQALYVRPSDAELKSNVVNN